MADTATHPAPSDRAHRAGKRYIYSWGGGRAEGDATMRDLLGGKGAGLAEMTNAGLPVPPGFTITTEACNDYFANGEKLPEGLWDDVLEAVKELERLTGKGFGDPKNPLLVSVRSGAKFSMPGMMDTVLNLGLNEETLGGLVALTGNERFGWDAYRRFIQMFGRIVLEVDPERFDHALEARKKARGVKLDTDLSAEDLRELVDEFKAHRPRRDRTRLPDRSVRAARPRDQGRLRLLVRQARPRLSQQPEDPARPRHRRQRRDDGLRQHGRRLGHGRRVHPRPEHRREGALRRVPDERPGRGRRGRHPHGAEDRPDADRHAGGLRASSSGSASSSRSTTATSRTWSSRSSAASSTCSRRAARSGRRAAAVKIAVDMVDEGVINKEEAIGRVEPAHVDQLLRATSSTRPPSRRRPAIVEGPERLARRGRRPGRVRCRRRRRMGRTAARSVVLVRIETSPDDFHGMAVAEGILTARGGATSHAAVVARQIGKPCVAGCARAAHRLRARKTRPLVRPGIGSRRATGSASTARPARSSSARCRPSKPASRTSPSSRSCSAGPTSVRRMEVWTNADKPEEAAQARGYGAQGIGLCRTEHMFREGERLDIVRGAILVASQATRAKAKRDAGGDLTADEREAVETSTRPWPSSRSSSRATSRASSRRWTACPSSSA